MTTRAFVLIFFMWALLTIITPTLIMLSESSKTDLDQNGKASEGMKPRKMMPYLEKHTSTPITPPPKNVTDMSPTPAPAPAPAPALPPTSEVDEPALRVETISQKQRDQ